LLVVKGKACKGLGQREDNVEVFNRQQFSLPALEPLDAVCPLAFRTVAVSAGVVTVACVTALAAFFGMSSQGGGAAELNGAHDTQLLKRESAGGAVSLAMLPENAGQFVNRPGQQRP
jgi:hypothetical protein